MAPFLHQVAADLYLRAGGNELLNYLKVQEAACLTELTACARDDTYEAMNAFIHRLLGTGGSPWSQGTGIACSPAPTCMRAQSLLRA